MENLNPEKLDVSYTELSQNLVGDEDVLLSKKTASLGSSIKGRLEKGAFQSVEDKARELFESNLFSQAQEILSTLHARSLGTAQTYSLMGVCCHQKNQFKEALKCYQRALEMDPQHLESLLNLSLLHLDLGNYKKGNIHYRKAFQTRLNKTHREWNRNISERHTQLGAAYFKKGLFHEALLEFLKAASKKNTSELSLEICIIKCLWKLDRKKEAVQKLQKLKRQNPLSIEVPLLLGQFYFQSRKIPQAISEWERVLRLDAGNKKALDFLQKTQHVQSVREDELA